MDASELKTERFQMMIEKSTMNAVDDWSFRNRVRSRAEAMRLLISKGLASDEKAKGDATA
ncbi:hypothetical protein [Rhizobium sp. PP-CC-3G-465]|uniref:hypothetical protein n=1 Tax=Rhizobium sp. PP-CC-3G-465 TaxID=2135648 RepID=UPI00104CAE7E